MRFTRACCRGRCPEALTSFFFLFFSKSSLFYHWWRKEFPFPKITSAHECTGSSHNVCFQRLNPHFENTQPHLGKWELWRELKSPEGTGVTMNSWYSSVTKWQFGFQTHAAGSAATVCYRSSSCSSIHALKCRHGPKCPGKSQELKAIF